VDLDFATLAFAHNRAGAAPGPIALPTEIGFVQDCPDGVRADVGATYSSNWAAWAEAPEYPPCTHCAELMAVDLANAETPLGHVTDLANLVHVPATGASDAKYVYNVKPGDYHLDITPACAWQIALTPT